MVVVFSHWDAWHAQNYVPFMSEEKFNIAYISNHLAQKAGFQTVLYTDRAGKVLLKDIPYSEVIEMDQSILEQLPHTMWSAGKILAASMEKRPFVHIDFDLFILNNKFYDIIKDKNFITYHSEPWIDTTQPFIEAARHIDKKTFNILKYPNVTPEIISYNFAIFGSYKPEIVNIINKKCEFIIEGLIKHKKILTKHRFIKKLDNYFPELPNMIIPVIIEQVLTAKLIESETKNDIYTLIDIKSSDASFAAGNNIGLLHLWGSKKSKMIQNKLKEKVQKYLSF
jgi:hypothetical protein